MEIFLLPSRDQRRGRTLEEIEPIFFSSQVGDVDPTMEDDV